MLFALTEDANTSTILALTGCRWKIYNSLLCESGGNDLDLFGSSICRNDRCGDTGARRRRTERKLRYSHAFHGALEMGERVGTLGAVRHACSPMGSSFHYRSTSAGVISGDRSPASTSLGDRVRCGLRCRC